MFFRDEALVFELTLSCPDSEEGRVNGKTTQNELHCCDTAPLKSRQSLLKHRWPKLALRARFDSQSVTLATTLFYTFFFFLLFELVSQERGKEAKSYQ